MTDVVDMETGLQRARDAEQRARHLERMPPQQRRAYEARGELVASQWADADRRIAAAREAGDERLAALIERRMSDHFGSRPGQGAAGSVAGRLAVGRDAAAQAVEDAMAGAEDEVKRRKARWPSERPLGTTAAALAAMMRGGAR